MTARVTVAVASAVLALALLTSACDGQAGQSGSPVAVEDSPVATAAATDAAPDAAPDSAAATAAGAQPAAPTDSGSEQQVADVEAALADAESLVASIDAELAQDG